MNLIAAKTRLMRLLLAYTPQAYGLLTGKVGRFDKARPTGRGPGQCDENRRPRILLVDHDFPELGRDAGSKAIFHLAGLLNDKAKVTFWSASSSPSAVGAKSLQSLGIDVVAKTPERDLAQWLYSLAKDEAFDAAVLSRPIIAAMYRVAVQKYVVGVCAYYGHDIHYIRLMGMRAIASNVSVAAEQREIGRIERRLWRTMDKVFYPSDEEVAIVNAFRTKHGLPPNAVQLPLWDAPEAPRVMTPASARSGMLFVGSFGHPPNIDGLDWFFEKILPEIRGLGCQEMVYIVGFGMDGYHPATVDSHVVVLGHIDDEALDDLYAKVRVALVPLRYGAGVKGKVIEAMEKKVPCVTTSVGSHGMTWATELLEPVDSAEDFASAVVRLTVDEVLWQKKSTEGSRLLSAAYERSAIFDRLFSALDLLPASCSVLK